MDVVNISHSARHTLTRTGSPLAGPEGPLPGDPTDCKTCPYWHDGLGACIADPFRRPCTAVPRRRHFHAPTRFHLFRYVRAPRRAPPAAHHLLFPGRF